MITVIRGPPFKLFNYWKKPVTGRLGQSSQNDRFVTVIGTQEWFPYLRKAMKTGFRAKTADSIQTSTPLGSFKSP